MPIIEGQIFRSTLRLEGAANNDTVVRDCAIVGVAGDGVLLRNVSNVRIENCLICDVSDVGIRVSGTGSTSDVQIVGCTIQRTGKDGIYSGENPGILHPGLQIVDNLIEDAGLAWRDSGLLHGMYIQSGGFIIRGNTVLRCPDGNGISVRSSGVIEQNRIMDAYKGGIAYYADHPAIAGEPLIIRDNIVAYVGGDGSRASINVLNIPTPANAVTSFTVTGNTVTGRGVIVDPGVTGAGHSVTNSGNSMMSNVDAAAILLAGAAQGAS